LRARFFGAARFRPPFFAFAPEVATPYDSQMRFAGAFLLSIWSLLLLAGCGGGGASSLWPFGDSETPEISRRPANATEYRCDGGKAFFVRSLDATAVWLIAPDREIRLDRQPDGRYSVGRVVLEIDADRAELSDPPSIFANCKRATAGK